MSTRDRATPRHHGAISPRANGALVIMLGVYALLCIVPVVLLVSASFSDEQSITLKGYSIIPWKPTLEAYKFIFSTRGQMLSSYGVTTTVTVVGTLLSLLLMSLYAYPLSRKDFRYRNFFSFFIFFTMLFNGGLVSWYLVSTQVLHLQDSLRGLIFPYLVNAWWVLILKTFFASNIHESIVESAKLDGAGELTIFIRIIIPLSVPGLATIGLFATLQYWNDWWLGLMFINSSKLMPLQYLMYRTYNAIQYLLANAGNIGGGLAGDILSKLPAQTSRMAMVVAGIGPILIAFPFFQRYFIKGLTVGAIKG